MTIPIGYHELPETLEVWRNTLTEDEWGGSQDELTQVDSIRARVSQPAAVEQVEAMQPGSALSIIVYARPDADVRRGDELRRSDGDRLRVKSTLHPSERVYLRADCEQIQVEGEA